MGHKGTGVEVQPHWGFLVEEHRDGDECPALLAVPSHISQGWGRVSSSVWAFRLPHMGPGMRVQASNWVR